MRKNPSQEDRQTENCSLCQQRFPKGNLVERQVGDAKLFYFCSGCIAGLVDDAKRQITDAPNEITPLISDISEKHRTN